MNNIQKNFKAKRGLCMAQGGLLSADYEATRQDQQALSQRNAELTAGAQAQMAEAGKQRMDSIGSTAGLSSRQRMGALMETSGEMAKMGVRSDPMGGMFATSGLSARQALKFGGAQFSNNNAANGFDLQQNMRSPLTKPQAPGGSFSMAGFNPTAMTDTSLTPTQFQLGREGNASLTDRNYGYEKPATGLRLADGTANVAQAAQPETPEQVMARMAAKYGVSAQPTATPVQAPQPVQQAPAPQRQGLIGGAMGLLKGRAAQIDRAVNGYAEGGIVRGKGGPTDDEVPMRIAGTDVNLSPKEAVLPVKTVHALGGPEAVEHLIETTNGKPPVRGGLRAGGEYEGGTGGWSLGSGQKPTIYDNGGLSAPVVQAGIDTMRGQLADTRDPRRMSSGAIREVGSDLGAVKEDPEALMQRVAKTHGLEYQTPAAVPTVRGQDTPTDPDTDGRRTYSPGYGKSFVKRGLQTGMVDGPGAGIFKMPVFDKAGGDKELAAARANGRFDNSPERSLVDNTLGKDAAVPQGLRNRWADNDPVKAQQYVSKDNAANGLRNNPADGHGVVSIKQADGKFKNVLMSPSQYTGADGKPTSDWSKTAQFAQGTAQAAKDKASLRDLEYSNAKFNATSDQITDPNARAAGLRALAQYDQEAALAAKVAESNAKAQHDNMQLQLTKRGQDITMRGQDNMQGNSARDAAAAAEKVKQADANTAAELYFTTNDEKTGDKIVNYGALGKFNRWRSSFAQNDPRAKLEQSELFRRFIAEQSIKERGAGGSKTELPINHTGTRQAGLRDVFTSGNGVFLPTGRVETFDNGAALRSSSIPKDEYDTRRLLGLDK